MNKYYYIILYYFVLYYIMLYYIILSYLILYYIILYYIFYYIILYFIILYICKSYSDTYTSRICMLRLLSLAAAHCHFSSTQHPCCTVV
jgi:hypothetical protein